eukprot:TRINITY_DN8905_c0_g1_i1.p1 TRINITY_DN8905_c0_g1~~TRINITY_DN8905_c0_g1_i1.p1  ORF type:complete len:159 (+),score=28.09 TRINITY_DN8905_c0_g1_i1:3-479(+)
MSVLGIDWDAPNDSVPTLIREGVYLGDCFDALNKEGLQSLGVRYILACQHYPELCATPQFPKDFKYMLIDIQDGVEDVLRHFKRAFKFIDKGRRKGGVLVHCGSGISRSTTFVVGYLMKKEGLSLRDALDEVKRERDIVDPNPYFRSQLKKWEGMISD